MLQSRRAAIVIGLLALVLVVLVQALSWYQNGRFNPGAWLLLVFIVPPLWIALRGQRRDDSGPPSA
ncbi:MAG: hypothetical protein WD737_13435 [Gemmatimonadota bacterium]